MKIDKHRNLSVKLTQYCNLTLTATFLIMWALSYHFYTSFGIDTDKVEGDQVLGSYYRIRWPGNGSFWLGGGADYRRLAVPCPVEEFDLGGTFFDKPPRRPEPHSLWNRLGFWWIDKMNSRRNYLGSVWGFWVGIPSWMPAILIGIWPLRGWLRSSRSKLHQSNSW